jgi:hypothetical protein
MSITEDGSEIREECFLERCRENRRDQKKTERVRISVQEFDHPAVIPRGDARGAKSYNLDAKDAKDDKS